MGYVRCHSSGRIHVTRGRVATVISALTAIWDNAAEVVMSFHVNASVSGNDAEGGDRESS